MAESLGQIMTVFGGLGMFLVGMDDLSEALEEAAGPRLKALLAALTRTPLLAMLAGLCVTAVLQSSSAVTVLVIGLVSAGLLGLPEAIAVLFGANVGTTVTAQLLAFRVGDAVGALLFLGFVLQAAGRRPRTKTAGRAVFALGLLFEGIAILDGVLAPLAAKPVFGHWMARVRRAPGLGLLLGLGMTLVVQSSSATIAVLQNFARQPGPDGLHSALGLAGALPILLGDNIGTTITAVLAAVGQNREAKRVAAAHCIFNLSGAVVCLCVLPGFLQLVEALSPEGPELDVIARQIANAHTLFNALCTLVWLPLLPIMVRLVTWLVPEKKREKSEAPLS